MKNHDKCSTGALGSPSRSVLPNNCLRQALSSVEEVGEFCPGHFNAPVLYTTPCPLVQVAGSYSAPRPVVSSSLPEALRVFYCFSLLPRASCHPGEGWLVLLFL